MLDRPEIERCMVGTQNKCVGHGDIINVVDIYIRKYLWWLNACTPHLVHKVPPNSPRTLYKRVH